MKIKAYEDGAANHLVEAAIKVLEAVGDELVEQEIHVELHELAARGARDGDLGAVALELVPAHALLVDRARALHLERECEHLLHRATRRFVVVEQRQQRPAQRGVQLAKILERHGPTEAFIWSFKVHDAVLFR